MNTNEPAKNKPSFIDLFSGAGGFSLGFVEQGFQDLLAIDNDQDAIATYNSNFIATVSLIKDIRKIHSLDILRTIISTPDVVLASPPCEPFTAANPQRFPKTWSRFYDDPQGDLIFHALRIIGDLLPKVFIIENVVPMISKDGKSILKEEFKKVGFEKIYFNIVDAEKHGCPSSRKRVFISNMFLKIPLLKSKNVIESLHDLPSPSLPNDYPNHVFVHLPQKVGDKLYKIKEGQAAVFFKGSKLEQKQWVKLPSNKIAPTIMGKSRFIHPIEDRAITPREQARLMSYPDNFEFKGNLDSVYNQIGESVPPIISNLIAQEIRKKLDNFL
ncbi:MAG: DNA cytosine methyltransferase [Candidatus Thorarchaeota archaeon]